MDIVDIWGFINPTWMVIEPIENNTNQYNRTCKLLKIDGTASFKSLGL